MLKRQSAAWISIVQHNPEFVKGLQFFIQGNPVSTQAAKMFQLQPSTCWVALQKGRKGAPEAALLAFSTVVSEEACEINPHTQHKELSMGQMVSLCDTINSYHVMERLMPERTIHVSVGLQAQLIQPVRLGDRLVLVSTIDKMGKNLVYCKSEFYRDEDDEAIPEERRRWERESVKTVHDIKTALREYKRVVAGTHVKSILHGINKQ